MFLFDGKNSRRSAPTQAPYPHLIAEQVGDVGYEPFPGIVLTDTFQLGEAGVGTGRWDAFPINNERAERQQKLDIRVILGNPPYSAGQDSANENNANPDYPALDESTALTHAKRSTATLKNSLYDSYIRAIRWATKRVLGSPDGGIVAFVTNGGYIDGNTADGLRLTFADEVSPHLRLQPPWQPTKRHVAKAGRCLTLAVERP